MNGETSSTQRIEVQVGGGTLMVLGLGVIAALALSLFAVLLSTSVAREANASKDINMQRVVAQLEANVIGSFSNVSTRLETDELAIVELRRFVTILDQGVGKHEAILNKPAVITDTNLINKLMNVNTNLLSKMTNTVDKGVK